MAFAVGVRVASKGHPPVVIDISAHEDVGRMVGTIWGQKRAVGRKQKVEAGSRVCRFVVRRVRGWRPAGTMRHGGCKGRQGCAWL
jgi:hypothetical protein